jgi:polar amino acid transport system substrate-binding protein
MRRLLFGALVMYAGGVWAQPLVLHFQERPPYSSRQSDGSVVGLVATPAAAALQRAGIEFRWELTPSQRQLALIQGGRGLQCGLGWFRNDERARLGRFSEALYRDKALAALVRDGVAVPPQPSAEELLAGAPLRLLVKDGYSYGPLLDGLIAAHPRAVSKTHVDPPQMSQMLRSGRADWMIVAPEEAEVLGGQGLKLLPLKDLPAGQTRHLYCTFEVPADLLQRFDRALRPAR